MNNEIVFCFVKTTWQEPSTNHTGSGDNAGNLIWFVAMIIRGEKIATMVNFSKIWYDSMIDWYDSMIGMVIRDKKISVKYNFPLTLYFICRHDYLRRENIIFPDIVLFASRLKNLDFRFVFLISSTCSWSSVFHHYWVSFEKKTFCLWFSLCYIYLCKISL